MYTTFEWLFAKLRLLRVCEFTFNCSNHSSRGHEPIKLCSDKPKLTGILPQNKKKNLRPPPSRTHFLSSFASLPFYLSFISFSFLLHITPSAGVAGCRCAKKILHNTMRYDKAVVYEAPERRSSGFS